MEAPDLSVESPLLLTKTSTKLQKNKNQYIRNSDCDLFFLVLVVVNPVVASLSLHDR